MFLVDTINNAFHFAIVVMSGLVFRAFGKVMDSYTAIKYGKEGMSNAAALSEIVDTDIFDNEVKMSSFVGNVLLIVNVASNCGLTKANYQQLPKLVDEYGERGLKVLAFPCNQFGGQEPGSPADILQFVKKYDEKMSDKLFFFSKGDVNGANTREIYKFIKPLALNFDDTLDLRWNFRK